MRFIVPVICLIALTACAAPSATPANTPIPGAPNLEVSLECTEDNLLIFEVHNAGDPIPSEGWAYQVMDSNGEIVEQGGTSLTSDDTEAIVMDDAGPYTLVMPDAGIEQVGECPLE